MITKTRMAVNLVGATRTWCVFNDKLTDGRRSLKVEGWKLDQYERAKAILELAGCKAVIKFVKYTAKWGSRAGEVCYTTRLHVTE